MLGRDLTALLTARGEDFTALTRADKALDLILQKSLQNVRASAFYYYLCGGFCAAGAIAAYFYLPVPFLVWFTAGCAILFTASGFWYSRIARKTKL